VNYISQPVRLVSEIDQVMTLWLLVHDSNKHAHLKAFTVKYFIVLSKAHCLFQFPGFPQFFFNEFPWLLTFPLVFDYCIRIFKDHLNSDQFTHESFGPVRLIRWKWPKFESQIEVLSWSRFFSGYLSQRQKCPKMIIFREKRNHKLHITMVCEEADGIFYIEGN